MKLQAEKTNMLRAVVNCQVPYPVVSITWVCFALFWGKIENFKVKKLLLDDVLQSSRYYHWIPLDLVYLVVTLRSSRMRKLERERPLAAPDSLSKHGWSMGFSQLHEHCSGLSRPPPTTTCRKQGKLTVFQIDSFPN